MPTPLGDKIRDLRKKQGFTNVRRYQLGMPEFLQKFSGQAEDKEKADEQQREAMTKLLESIESLNKGSVAQRLRVIIVLGELDGPNRAIAELDKLEALAKKFGHKFTPDEQRQLEVLNRLYKDCIDGRPNVPTMSRQRRSQPLLEHSIASRRLHSTTDR